MTNEQAYAVLENCASLLDSGTRFFTEDHTKQFQEAYELAMKALRKTERKTGKWSIKNGELAFWDVCSECGRMVIHKAPFYNFCPHCGADMRPREE